MYVVAIPMPDDCKEDLLNAFAETYGWAAQIPDPATPGKMMDNPVTQEQFLEDRVSNYLVEVTKAHLVRTAAATAIQTAQAATDARVNTIQTWYANLRAQRTADGLATFGGDASNPQFQAESVDDSEPEDVVGTIVAGLQSSEKRTRRSGK